MVALNIHDAGDEAVIAAMFQSTGEIEPELLFVLSILTNGKLRSCWPRGLTEIEVRAGIDDFPGSRYPRPQNSSAALNAISPRKIFAGF
jgi:hypothetical protein